MKISFLLILTYYLFTFVFAKIHLIHYFLIYFFPLITILLNFNMLKRLYSCATKQYSFNITILIYAVLVLWSLVYPTFRGTYDYSYINTLLSILRLSIKTIFIAIVFIKIHREQADLFLFIDYFTYANIIYIFSSLFFGAFPKVKLFWNSLIYQSELNRSLVFEPNYVLRFGFVGFSGFQQTFIVSLASLFNAMKIIEKDRQGEKTFKYLCFQGILFLGTTFYGRVGVVYTTMLMIILIMNLSYHRITNMIKVVLLAFIFFVLIIFVSKQYDFINVWINWGFALFFNFFRNGEIGTGSSKIMFENMYFKIPISTLFIGDGYYMSPEIIGSYYMQTDVGFMRPILFFGLFFTVLNYLLVFILIIGLYRSLSYLNYKTSNFFLIMQLLLLIVFEMKGEIFYRMFGYLLSFYLISIHQEITKLKYNDERIKTGG